MVPLTRRMKLRLRKTWMWLHDTVPGSLSVIGISLIAVLVSVPVSLFVRGSIDSAFFSSLFTAVASLIGTLLVLTITLSVLTIQKSSDSFSSVITSLYIRDKKTHATFLLLGAITVVAYSLSYPPIIQGMPVSFQLPIACLMVGTAIDLLRKHFVFTGNLLNLDSGLRLYRDRLAADLARLTKRAGYWARHQHRTLPKQEQETTPVEYLEARILANTQNHVAALKQDMAGLTALASAYLHQGRADGFQATVHVMSYSIQRYIEFRRGVVSQLMSGDALIVKHAEEILNAFYEHLRQLGTKAVHARDELCAVALVRSLGEIAELTGKINVGHDSPLLHGSVWYLSYLLKQDKEKNLDEMAWNAAPILESITRGLAQYEGGNGYVLTVLNGWRDAFEFYLLRPERDIQFVNVYTRMWVSLNNFIDHPYGMQFVLGEMRKISHEYVAQYFAADRVGRRTDIPIFLPFNPASNASITHVLQVYTERAVTRGPKHDRFYELTLASEEVYHMLRNVIDEFPIGRTLLASYVVETIRSILMMFASLVKQTSEGNNVYDNELGAMISNYAHLPHWMFREPEKVNYDDVKIACDALAALATSLMGTPYLLDLKKYVSSLEKLLAFSFPPCEGKTQWDVAEIWLYAIRIKVMARLRGCTWVVASIDNTIITGLESLEKSWRDLVIMALDNRWKHFQRDVVEHSPERFIVRTSASLLPVILAIRQYAEQNQMEVARAFDILTA